ncbi:MAG TPA: cytosine permease [Rhodanobacteraceae bacterium]
MATHQLIEHRSIDWIPAAERHGHVWSQFTVWFAANMQITTIVTGALAIVLGLSLTWAIVAILIGNLVGATVMALHSAQGPKLGVPQMIQSRAQFGFLGAIVPLVLVFLMYIGFFASSGVLGGQALSAWLGIPIVPSIIIVNAICTIGAIFGYNVIHHAEHYISVISGLGFLYLSIVLVLHYHGLARATAPGSFSGGIFLLAIAISATWQITFAPYVADYSRYLPETTPMKSTFLWTYTGSVIGTVWMMIFGAVVATLGIKAFNTDSVTFIVSLAPHASAFVFYIVILLGVFAINTLNLYGAFMSTVTTITALLKIRVGTQSRAWFIVAVAILGTIVASIGYSSFMTNFQNFILFLAYFLIPWTGVNLMDFYFVRRGRYDIKSITDIRDSIYGMWQWRTLTAYIIGIVVEIPFMSTTFYTGFMVPRLGGADISWILGIIVSAGLYAALHASTYRKESAHFAQAIPAGLTVTGQSTTLRA